MPLNPPPVVDERDGLATFLTRQQAAVRALAVGLTDAQAHRARSASTISIAWLLKHLSAVQQNWLEGALAAPAALTQAQNDAIVARFGDPDGTETLAELLADFDATCVRVVEAVRTLDPETPLPVPDAPWFPDDVEHWSLRWVWLHLIQELARHAGHGDIVRESLDGATAIPLLMAAEELPDNDWLAAWQPGPQPFTSGISTVTLAADDLATAKQWYAELLGAEPYYDTPVYLEWRVGPHRHEIGLLDRRFAGAGWAGEPAGAAGGAVVHLWVEDTDAALEALVARGATVHQPARDFGDGTSGYRGGSVVDPFGNMLGVITRPG